MITKIKFTSFMLILCLIASLFIAFKPIKTQAATWELRPLPMSYIKNNKLDVEVQTLVKGNFTKAKWKKGYYYLQVRNMNAKKPKWTMAKKARLTKGYYSDKNFISFRVNSQYFALPGDYQFRVVIKYNGKYYYSKTIDPPLFTAIIKTNDPKAKVMGNIINYPVTIRNYSKKRSYYINPYMDASNYICNEKMSDYSVDSFVKNGYKYSGLNDVMVSKAPGSKVIEIKPNTSKTLYYWVDMNNAKYTYANSHGKVVTKLLKNKYTASSYLSLIKKYHVSLEYGFSYSKKNAKHRNYGRAFTNNKIPTTYKDVIEATSDSDDADTLFFFFNNLANY